MTSKFYKAPASKLLLLSVFAGSILTRHFEAADFVSLQLSPLFRRFQFHRLLTSQIPFLSLPELLVGSTLLYIFRCFEIRMGTQKFLVYSLLGTAISLVLQIGTLAFFPDAIPSLSPGPFALIFSLFVQYFAKVPKSQTTSFAGGIIEFSDKSLTYFLGTHLLLAQKHSSFAAGIVGLVAGAILSSPYFPLDRIKMPQFLVSFATDFILPIVSSAPPADPGAASSSSAAAAARPAASNPAAPRAPASRGRQNLMFGNDAVPTLDPPRRQATPPPPPESAIETLIALGFSREQAIQALVLNNNDVNLAANSLMGN